MYSIYIYKAEKPSDCLSVHHADNHLRLPTSTYQLLNIINPSSSYFKFVTASECSDQIAFCSGLNTKKWRKLKQYSIEYHSHMAQWVEQLTCIQEVAGSNPVGKQIFFSKINAFCMQNFLKFSDIPSTHRNGTRVKLNARHLGTQLW